MNELVVNGGLMFTWMSLRDQMAEDLKAAAAALEKAEGFASRKPSSAKDEAKAWKRFEKGVTILSTYPLDPETTFNWAKEVLEKPLGSTGIAGLWKSNRIERIVRRIFDKLNAARDGLVLPNLRLVLKEVFRYHPVGMKRSDLFQEGVLGLQKAIFRYDPTRGTRFSTYATYWIRQSIRKSLIDKSRMIRVPQGVQENLRKEDCKLSEEEAARIRRVMSETVLFSAADNDDGGDRNLFVVRDTNEHAQSEVLHTNTIPKEIIKALDRLEGREREVIARRFGLEGEKPQTLEQIGTRMNLSRERIRQIEKEALGHMKQIPGLQEVYEDLGKASFNGYTSKN
ncbi:MAG: sigma-70 family RNA polymerase sigma factor [Planctomycetota bacterium]|nr:sigma-70 family RNA polymerase sigma factor [Planctomycetota bacterium]MEC8935314.1 sigma-70 family RNA polymerase sigma factor [Planctomycetota bacterium]MEC9350253.1 sigma-70 family RNA polymerase sigma factor [Planctomycetota bacterium]